MKTWILIMAFPAHPSVFVDVAYYDTLTECSMVVQNVERNDHFALFGRWQCILTSDRRVTSPHPFTDTGGTSTPPGGSTRGGWVIEQGGGSTYPYDGRTRRTPVPEGSGCGGFTPPCSGGNSVK